MVFITKNRFTADNVFPFCLTGITFITSECIAKHLLNRTNTNIGFLAGGLVIVYIVACIFFYSVS